MKALLCHLLHRVGLELNLHTSEGCLCYILIRMIHRSQVLSHDSLTTTNGGTITTVLLAKELSLRDAHELQGEPLPARGRVDRLSAGPRASLCWGPGHTRLSLLGAGGAGPSAGPRAPLSMTGGAPGQRPGHTPVCVLAGGGGAPGSPPGHARFSL